MLISHKHKFVFIHISKNAGTSISKVLSPYSEIKATNLHKRKYALYRQHTTASQLKTIFENHGWDWNEYFSFGIVRNPWARIVSKYEFWKQTANNEKKSNFWDFCKRVTDQCGTFSELLSSKYPYNQPSQSDFIYESANLLVNFVGRYENLEQDFDKICERIGVPRMQLPVLHKTYHNPYCDYYTDKTQKIIAEKYAEDIENFKYKFI